MDGSTSASAELAPSHGKRRLLEAALRIAARDGVSLSALGLRELAREAELNANTFYRHFDAIDDLARELTGQLATQFMQAMAEVRRKAARHADATEGAVRYFFDFVRDNSDVFVVGVRELHSANTPMRAVLQDMIERIAAESVEQILELDLAPGVAREALLEATRAITYQMFYRGLDYLERPRSRTVIAEQLVWTIRALFLGARKG